MAKKVLFLPGILGSELWESALIPFVLPDRRIWIDPVQLLGGALLRLQLALDGVSPGPFAGGASIYPRSPLSQFYGPMRTWLQVGGYDLLYQGYDWRRSILDAGSAVWAAVRPWLGLQQLFIVAHSQGGLVARAVYGAMQTTGQGGQLGLLITVGTPHYGAWEAALVWWHLARLYRWLLETCQKWVNPLAGALAGYIDGVVGTWPALYTLMPWRDYGPLAQAHPDQAQQLYAPAYYAQGASPAVAPFWLARAPTEQAILQSLLPTGQMVGIYGTNNSTVDFLAAGGSPASAGGYDYTLLGDGTVTVAQGSVPGMQVYTVDATHEVLCMNGLVWALVSSLLGRP